MAVFTHITDEMLRGFLARYDLGELVRFEGIAQGVSNSNFHVFTDQGRFILTIFEEHRTKREDLPYLFAYAGHLAGHGIPCPQAYVMDDGSIIRDLAGKPTALINFLEGRDVPGAETTAEHCFKVGVFSAKMHKAAADFPLHRVNDWGSECFAEKLAAIREKVELYEAGLGDFLEEEICYLNEQCPEVLPRAAVHLDLFPDNVFFQNGEISAMIDMYFAAHDALIYDMAITMNAWCGDVKAEAALDKEKVHAYLQGYETIRPLEDVERKTFGLALRTAAMRFLLSRLEELLNHDPEKTEMQPHDPQEYLAKVKFYQNQGWEELGVLS